MGMCGRVHEEKEKYSFLGCNRKQQLRSTQRSFLYNSHFSFSFSLSLVLKWLYSIISAAAELHQPKLKKKKRIHIQTLPNDCHLPNLLMQFNKETKDCLPLVISCRIKNFFQENNKLTDCLFPQRDGHTIENDDFPPRTALEYTGHWRLKKKKTFTIKKVPLYIRLLQ